MQREMNAFSDTVPQRPPGPAWRMRSGEQLLIDIDVAYPPAGPGQRESQEHYAVELAAHSRANALLQLQTWAHGRRTTTTLDRSAFTPPRSRGDWCHTALDAVLLALYGELHPAPRLIGSTEWGEARLSVHHVLEGRREALRSYELRVVSSGAGWWRVHEGSWCHAHRTVALCREDADPVYALTRLGRQAEQDIADDDGEGTPLHLAETSSPLDPLAHPRKR